MQPAGQSDLTVLVTEPRSVESNPPARTHCLMINDGYPFRALAAPGLNLPFALPNQVGIRYNAGGGT
jgi:hypothetical protein